MDPKGRKYNTTANDRAKRNKAKAKPPQMAGLFSTSDSESETFQISGKRNAAVRRSPNLSPLMNQHCRVKSPAVRFIGAETDAECCENCNLPFGYAENMVCSHCSGTFCCKCAKVPEIVATVQFSVPNLRWFCPACDQITSEILRNHREGRLVPRPLASTPNKSVETRKTKEIAMNIESLNQRMDGYEVILNEVKNMIVENTQIMKSQTYSQAATTSQRTPSARTGSNPSQGINPQASVNTEQSASQPIRPAVRKPEPKRQSDRTNARIQNQTEASRQVPPRPVRANRAGRTLKISPTSSQL